MDRRGSLPDKNAEIIGKLSKEIKILKKTIKEFKRNKVHSWDIEKAEGELYNLKVNLDYFLRSRKSNLNPLDWFSPINFNFRIDDITETWYYANSYIPTQI